MGGSPFVSFLNNHLPTVHYCTIILHVYYSYNHCRQVPANYVVMCRVWWAYIFYTISIIIQSGVLNFYAMM